MNPILAILILIPLLVSAALLFGAAIGLVKEGPRWDVLLALAFLSAICGYLLRVFTRALSRKGSLLEFPGSDQLDLGIRESLTKYVLLLTCFTMLLLASFVIEIDSMRNWIGLTFFLLGIATCYSAISRLGHREDLRHKLSIDVMAKQVKFLEAALAARTPRRIVYLLTVLLALGVYSVVYYNVLGGVKYLSVFDLLGFLFLDFSYGLAVILGRLSAQRRLLALKRNSVS